MYCSRGRVLCKNLTTLCCAASYAYFSSINYFYIEINIEINPKISGFGVWPERNFLLVFS